MRSPLLLLPLVIGLAACESQSSADGADGNASGTNINVAAKGDKGEDIRITADGDTGKVSVNLPGFDANVRLPKVMLKDTADGQFTTVDEVADAVLFFAGATSNAYTGQSLLVTHGWCMQ